MLCYKIKRIVLTSTAFNQSNKWANERTNKEQKKKRNLKAISGQAIECANFNLLSLQTAEITANDSQIMNDASHKHIYTHTNKRQTTYQAKLRKASDNKR